MSKLMVVKYSNDTEAIIELLDTPFVEYFLKNWGRLQKFPLKKGNSAYSLCDTTARFLTEEERNNKKTEYGGKLESIFAEMKGNWNIEFPQEITPDLSSKELNYIHRCFVTAVMTLNHKGFTFEYPDITHKEKIDIKSSRLEWVYNDNEASSPRQEWRDWVMSDNTKWIQKIKYNSEGYNRFMDLLHGVNHYVHLYENCYKTTDNTALGQEIINDRKILRVMRDFYDRGEEMAGKKLQTVNTFPSEFQNEVSFDNHDVWLSKDILGRDYLDAWMHHDDPANVDICNVCIRHSPNIMIDQENSFNDIMTSKPLREWFQSYKIPFEEKILANIPLGNIVNGWSIKEHIKNGWPNPDPIKWDLICN